VIAPRIAWLAASIVAVLLPVVAFSAPKTVMVYYMPWFTSKPVSGEWGWHWTMNHFDPERVNASGQREIASWYYPLIGPYDSSDPAVLEYHVLLMKLSGIDGVIVDWYGCADYLDYAVNNRAAIKLMGFTRRAGLKFSICYEDQTILHMIEGGFLARSNAIDRARRDMECLEKNFFSDATYFRLNGRPLLLNFGPQFFVTNSDWENLFSVLAASNRPAFFTEDNRLPVSDGAFAWPPMWLSQAPGTAGVLSDAALQRYLIGFDQKAAAWPLSVSSAFPRFHDVYQRSGVRNYWGYLGDRHGETFEETLRHAMTNQSPVVQIVTWNDFGEGTVVEPTEEYGYRDLGMLQDSRRRNLEPGFALGTNDLALAFDMFQLRKRAKGDDSASRDLDQAFTNIVSGDLDAARRRVAALKRNAVLTDEKAGRTPKH
jgi:hypothetical protein